MAYVRTQWASGIKKRISYKMAAIKNAIYAANFDTTAYRFPLLLVVGGIEITRAEGKLHENKQKLEAPGRTGFEDDERGLLIEACNLSADSSFIPILILDLFILLMESPKHFPFRPRYIAR